MIGRPETSPTRTSVMGQNIFKRGSSKIKRRNLCRVRGFERQMKKIEEGPLQDRRKETSKKTSDYGFT